MAKMTTNQPVPTPGINASASVLEEIEQLKRENEELNKRLETLQANKPGAGSLTFQVSPQGAISVYGLQRMPTTLYRMSWLRLLSVIEDLRAFLNDPLVADLASKGPADPRYTAAKAEQKARSLAVARGEKVPSSAQINPNFPKMVTRPVPPVVEG